MRATSPASRVALLVAALMVATVAPGPVGGVHLPTDDDAGSGTDAPNQEQAGLWIGEGSSTGNLTHFLDIEDDYRIDVPAGVVVRVNVSAPVRIVELWGPQGWDRDVPFQGPEPLEVSTAAPDGGVYNLSLRGLADHHDERFVKDRYTIQVTFESRDHFAPLYGSGQAAAWNVSVPEGGYARVDTFAYGKLRTEHLRDSGTYMALMLRPRFGEECEPGVAHGGTGGGAVTWPQPWGKGPVDAGPVPDDPTLATEPAGVFKEVTEAADGGFRVRHGVVNSEGLGLAGWVTWDDPIAPTIRNVTAEARFLATEDFEGDGYGLHAAGVTYADGPLSAQIDLPDNTTWTNLVWFKNREDPLTSEPPHLDFERPNRSRVGHVIQEWHLRAPWQFFNMLPWQTDNPPGTWDLRLRHHEAERDTPVRAVRASFNFAPDC